MTALYLKGADRQRAQNLWMDTLRPRHAALERAIDGFTRAVRDLREAGLPEHMPMTVDLADVRKLLLDALSEAAGMIEHDADAQHISVEMFAIDLSELGRA